MVSAKKIKTISFASQSSSAEAIANTEDLLTQILVCLPTKSLHKFKCVSKHWLSLISNPRFIRRLNLSDSPCALFIHVNKWPRSDIDPEYDFVKLDSNHDGDAPFRTLAFTNDPLGIKILQSCNGLLFCSSDRSYGYKENYYVYNPTTQQYAMLPPLSRLAEYCGPYLAFDPSKSSHYKVICLFPCDITGSEFEIEIYSSDTGLWRVSAEILTWDDLDNGFRGGVFWNGATHWYTDSGPSICFDVDQEQFREIPMPPMPDGWYQRRVKYFGECRGHLHLVEIHHAPSTQFNVSEMEKDCSGWSVKYRVDLDGVATAFPEMIRSYLEPSALNYYIFQIMCIVGGESDEDSYMVLHLPGKIIQFNWKDKSFNKLHDINPRNTAEQFAYYDAYEYIYSVARVW